MEIEDLEERRNTLVAGEDRDSDNSAEQDDFLEERVEDVDNQSENGHISEHDVIPQPSDEDTESLTGSLDGVIGGDEYELTGDDTDHYYSDPVTTLQTRQEKQQMLALKRHLDVLSEQVVQNEYMVSQSRDELKRCHETIENLESELDKTVKEIEEMEIDKNNASLFRLKSHYTKLCNEIEGEQQVAAEISEKLEKAEYTLSLASMEQGRFLLAGEELEKREDEEMKEKNEASAARIRKENVNAMVAEKRRQRREKENVTALRERERKHRHALAMAKKNREQASKFLKETMTRVRRKEAEDEEYHRVDMEKRIQNLLTLKANIESNKENLRAVQARTVHVQQQEQMREQEEVNELLKEGLNPEEVLTRRKRLRQFEKDKEAFEKRQRERQVEIADKLLREEKQMKKRYQQQPPQLWPDKQRERNKRLGRRKTKSKSFKVYSGSSSMEYSADGEDTGGAVFDQNKLIPVSSDDEDEFSPFGHTSRDEDQEGDSDNDDEEDLAEPEFKGLWQDGGENDKEKSQQKLKFTSHIPSKTEQEMMEKALAKQKQSIVQKQIAVGREFKGQAFYSKPEVVVFKDFDIGKTYRRKVVLTNVSYTQNFCKYIGMSSNLMDFVDIVYDPPGAMSAGLTCDFTVIFKPMLNEDIFGVVDFLAQTGPFSVSVECLTKKCQITVDKNDLNFGGQVLGETCKKVVTLINEGALGTTFVVSKRSGSPKSETFVELQSITDTTSVSEKATVAVTPEVDQLPEGIGTILEQATPDSSKQTEASAALSEKGSPTPVPECDITLSDDNVFYIGKISAGDVPPFSSVQIEVIFSPSKPGENRSEFNIAFADETLSTIPITAQGVGVDLPVWVEREVVDLKICMFDRLYQDALILNNRATSALRLKFEVCKELKDHLELLPKTAYIQAESQFSAQLKFLPRKSLVNDCPKYFNADTGILEAPMTIRVGDQTRPVCFTVRAVITPTDIEFNVQELDFGYCTTVESVRQTITMTNKSILPQMYGFCGVPQCLEVQSNDGFGTLLPLESLDVDVIFSAKKAKEYSLDLVCKNGIGTEYHIPCRGIGVFSPLDLSHNVISFRATAVGDSSNACISVTNSHQDGNEYTHDVPRIGGGSVAHVGPTSFEFIVPDGAPITVSPAVGVVLPGEHCNVEVTFAPQLDTEAIKVEAVRIAEKIAEFEQKISEENVGKEPTKNEENTNAGKKRLAKGDKKGGGKASPKRGQTPSTANIRNQATPGVKSVSDVVEGSDEFCAAKLSLLKSFTNVLRSYDIACFVASGQSSGPGTLDYDSRNTLYLKLHCPAVRPDITVISDNGRCSLNFEQVSVGQCVVKDVTIQNISLDPVHLSSSILDTHGPFELLNATRTLPPNGTHTCVIAFSPQTPNEFYEVLDLHSACSTIPIRLQGKGVEPVVCSSVNNGLLDFGYALVKDSAAMTFKLENTSELSVKFNVLLASLSSSRREQLRAVPKIAPHKQDMIVGSSNFNGEVVFDCVPSRGCIEPGKSQDFTVSFTPDHASECYADELSIVVSNSVSEKIRLQGKASSNIMFLQGWDHIGHCEESLCDMAEEDDEGVSQNVVLLLFESHCKPGQPLSPAERVIDVGCIKSNVATKRSGDFVFENPKEANEKGFSFDPVKGSVEVGHRKQITCRWQPTADQDPAVAVHGCTVLTVKSDVTVQYKILLRGLMVTD